jgi:hypothetical protein
LATVDHAANDPKAFPRIAQTGLTLFPVFVIMDGILVFRMSGEAQREPCSWSACNNPGMASLSGLWLCELHFYETATNGLTDFRARFGGKSASAIEREKVLEFLSELMVQTTNLIAGAEPLSQSQSDEFLELWLSAASFAKQIQCRPSP